MELCYLDIEPWFLAENKEKKENRMSSHMDVSIDIVVCVFLYFGEIIFYTESFYDLRNYDARIVIGKLATIDASTINNLFGYANLSLKLASCWELKIECEAIEILR